MSWTWLGALTAFFLVYSCFMGFKRGFVREVVSTFFVILSIVIVWFINPYVNEFIRENTPVYEKIQENCRALVENQENTAEVSGGTRQQRQDGMIDNLGLPQLFEDAIRKNNTAETYRYLSVNTFKDYVSGYLARVILNGLSFLISYLLATILVRMVTYALNILASLPVLRSVNKLAGALVGGMKFVLFVWIALLVLTVLCNTELGRAGIALVEKDYMLSYLYDRNIFAKIFMGIFYGSSI